MNWFEQRSVENDARNTCLVIILFNVKSKVNGIASRSQGIRLLILFTTITIYTANEYVELESNSKYPGALSKMHLPTFPIFTTNIAPDYGIVGTVIR